jgi:hypothetical protein
MKVESEVFKGKIELGEVIRLETYKTNTNPYLILVLSWNI